MEGSHRIANGMEFVNDPAVIGKWKSVGSLEAGEEFSLEKLNAFQKGELAEEIYFLPQGVSYWIFEGWTKGTLLLHYGGDAPILERSYQVVSREGRQYLLVTLPEEGHIAVFEQVDNTEYALESLGRRDNIDLPFVPDPDVVGLWKTVGFVERPEDFTGPNSAVKLWLETVEFRPHGVLIQQYWNEEPWHDRWTKGTLLLQKRHTAPSYELRDVEGKEYLFMEWKMGNYVFGGKEPSYYVLERA